ncbi:MAG TPA: DNA repair protein RadA [Acidimicrobiia bacterium]|nr:DNA repair protein RadA [Acidimicrobiia bacterium]
MARTHVRFHCDTCGFESPKWLGRCPDCGEWGGFGESAVAAVAAGTGLVSKPLPIAQVDVLGAPRRPTGIGEVDRVLGGGLVGGSVTLLGGEPGMGKSTLLLQMLGALATSGVRALLVTAEESAAQVRLRAERLQTLAPNLMLVAETSLPAVCAHVDELRPDVLAVDSIQSVHDPDSPGAAGSVSQVRDAAQRLVRLAKDLDVATVLVGHVTKDGALAGPRVLEHVVDTVLSFEGDRHHELRLLRALKHRFGATDEIGIMGMTGRGLEPIADPSALFLGDRRTGTSGSVVAPVLEGARPMCVEVQALVHVVHGGIPRRVTDAVDSNRLAMLQAVLEHRGGCQLGAADVYASVAGGVRLSEPGSDLALLLALASAHRNRAVDAMTVAMGEVGLGGEVRQVPQAPRRLAEAARLGFTRAIVPMSTPAVDGLDLVRVEDVQDALAVAEVGAWS